MFWFIHLFVIYVESILRCLFHKNACCTPQLLCLSLTLNNIICYQFKFQNMFSHYVFTVCFTCAEVSLSNLILSICSSLFLYIFKNFYFSSKSKWLILTKLGTLDWRAFKFEGTDPLLWEDNKKRGWSFLKKTLHQDLMTFYIKTWT